MAYTKSRFETTIFWALLAYIIAQQGCWCGSGSQSSQSNSARSSRSILPGLIYSHTCPPTSNCSKCSDSSGGGGSDRPKSYSRASNRRCGSLDECPSFSSSYGSGVTSCTSSSSTSASASCPTSPSTNPPNLPQSYHQPPCGSSHTYGPQSSSFSTVSAFSLPSPSGGGSYEYNPTIYCCNPPIVPSCPTPVPPSSHTSLPQDPIPAALPCPPTLPPYPSTQPPARPPSWCNGYNSLLSGNPSGAGSGSSNSMCTSDNPNSGSNSYPYTTQSPSTRCIGYYSSPSGSTSCPSGRSRSGSGSNPGSNSYACTQTSPVGCNGYYPSPSSENKPRTLIFCDRIGAPTQICTLSGNGSYVCSSICPSSGGYKSCAPNNNQNVRPSHSTCPAKPSSSPTQPPPTPMTPKTSSTSTTPPLPTPSTTAFYANPYPQAGLCDSSGNGKGGNRIYSCNNILTGPSCKDPTSNQNTYMINHSGNGVGGNRISSNVNCIFGGSMVKDSGNGKGGNCIKSCVNIIGGDAEKVMSNGALWKSLCNVLIGTGCRNCSSPFVGKGCPSFYYDDYSNSDPCSCSQDPGYCDDGDDSGSSCPSLPTIVICPQYSQCRR